MSGLAEQSLGGDDEKSALNRIALVLGLMAVLALLWWGFSQIKFDTPAPKRQTVKITLPDAPPPPPPPKVEDKKPEPKPEDKPQPQMEAKPVEAPPQPAESLKMEGAAGNGPSAFSAGSVNQDYSGGKVMSGGSTGGGNGLDRAKYQFYVNSAKQALKDALERQLQTDEKRITVTFSLWIGADGRVSRFELAPTGNERADSDVRTAFDKATQELTLPAPADTPQPLRLRMTLLPPTS
ncbi:MAG: TonB-dependent receptor [Rubrivivax sp.]|nr:MAG: TonB-dependent receptor [Rubrivivax sp.]